MKSHKRRSRIVAGLALVAASAAVASAMFGPVAAMAPPVSLPIASPSTAALTAHSPVAFEAEHAPLKIGTAGPRKRAGGLAMVVNPSAGALAAAELAGATTSSAVAFSGPSAWWLEYAGSCSRTRGQPRMDALT